MNGAGGMGDVYRARDTRLGRTVAIKFTRSDTAEATGARAQFEREGRAIAALNHRRICSVYDVGSFASQNYLVMECLDGETLEQQLRRGRLPLDELFTVAIIGLGYSAALMFLSRPGTRFNPTLASMRDLLLLLVVAAASAAFVASAYVSTLAMAGLLSPDNSMSAALRFWVGDMIGIAVVAPFGLSLSFA